MDNFTIERMNSKTILDVSKIEQACFSRPWSLKSIESELNNECAYFYTIRDNDNIIVGYGGMHIIIDECYVDNIAVLPEYQHKGIGKRIVNHLIEVAKSKGCNFISLEVRQSNTNAISLYKSFNFTLVGKRKNFYSLPTEDAYIFTKYFT